MHSGFLGGGIGPRAIARRRAAADWWLAGGTIALANVLEHVENPAAQQLYAGAAATAAWSVSFRTNLTGIPASTALAFDSELGRFLCWAGPTENGFFVGSTSAFHTISLFAAGDHSYMLVSNGTNVQAYRDNSAISTPKICADNIGGITRWGSRYVDSTGNWYEWPVALRAGHVANAALDATQRAALHTAMMALA